MCRSNSITFWDTADEVVRCICRTRTIDSISPICRTIKKILACHLGACTLGKTINFHGLYCPLLNSEYQGYSKFNKGQANHGSLWSFRFFGLLIGWPRVGLVLGLVWARDSLTVVFHRPVQLFDSFLFYLDVSLSHLDVANGILVFHFRSLGRVYLEHGLL